MVERFERLYKLPENLYIDGAPIIISAGALLKDNATGSVVAQLKFHSVTKNIIKAVKVSLCAYDVSNSEIEGVNDYQYLDLSVCNGQEFGSNKAIVLPQAITRSFYISDITIVFSDDTKWRCEDTTKLKQLPLSKPLNAELHNAELEKQYKLSTTPSATYVPFETMSIWNCTCGEWNSDSKCTKCSSVRQTVFSAFDTENLQTAANNRIAAEQAQREEDARLAAEAEIKRKELEAEKKEKIKHNIKIAKKVAIILVPIIIVVLAWIYWLNPVVIRPAIAYSDAEKLLSSGNYDEAEDAFSALGNYRNSKEKVLESQYQKAYWLMENDNVNEALDILIELCRNENSSGQKSDTVEKSKEILYTQAQELLKNSEYVKAISAFEALGNYKESATHIKTAKYNYAQVLFKKAQYVDAKAVFSEIPSHSDSDQMLIECDYQIACEYITASRHSEALSIFLKMSDYKDSKEKISACKYAIASNYLSEGKFVDALTEFKSLGNYSDSKQKITECIYMDSKRLITAGEYKKATEQLNTISNYKDSAKYIQLMKDAVSMVFSWKETTYDTSYMWIISEIDTKNCKSELLVFTGNALGKNDSLDSATAKPEYAIKCWKKANGNLYMSQGGEDPTKGRNTYNVWTVLGNWTKITSKTYTYTGNLLDSQSKTWVRVENDLSQKIKQSFVTCFATYEYTQWKPEDYAYLRALIKQ